MMCTTRQNINQNIIKYDRGGPENAPGGFQGQCRVLRWKIFLGKISSFSREIFFIMSGWFLVLFSKLRLSFPEVRCSIRNLSNKHSGKLRGGQMNWQIAKKIKKRIHMPHMSEKIGVQTSSPPHPYFSISYHPECFTRHFEKNKKHTSKVISRSANFRCQTGSRR